MHFQIESMGSVAKSIECDGSPYSLEGHSLVSIQHEGKSGWFMYGLTPIPEARSSSFSI